MSIKEGKYSLNRRIHFLFHSFELPINSLFSCFSNRSRCCCCAESSAELPPSSLLKLNVFAKRLPKPILFSEDFKMSRRFSVEKKFHSPRSLCHMFSMYENINPMIESCRRETSDASSAGIILSRIL